MKLIKTVLNEGVVLVESSGQLPSGVLARIKGPFSGYGTAGKNHRTYSRQLWEKVIKDHGSAFKTRTCLGEADHPETEDVNRVASYSIPRVSHVITAIRLVGGYDKGIVEGEADILDTPAGRIVYTLLKAGVPVGVSVRALGEVDESGWVVTESYHFVSFDFVLNPSFEKARIESIMAESAKTLFEAEILKGLINSDLHKVQEGVDVQVKEVTPTTFIYEMREVEVKPALVSEGFFEKEKIQEIENSLRSVGILLHEIARLQYKLRRAEKDAKVESESVKIQLQAVTEKVKKEITVAVSELKDSYEKSVKALNESHMVEIKKLEQDHNKLVAVMESGKVGEVTALTRKYKNDIAKIEGVYKVELATMSLKIAETEKVLKEKTGDVEQALKKLQETTVKLDVATKEISQLLVKVEALKKYEEIHRRYYKSLEGTSILSLKSEDKLNKFIVKLERL